MRKNRTVPFFLALLTASIVFAEDVKKADLAGTWYTGSEAQLRNELEGYLTAANPEKIDGKIFAIISPHAGYRFSGPVAAYGFKALEGQSVKTAIVIGFSHRKFFDGISVYTSGSFETPLGRIPVDTELASDIVRQNRRIRFYPPVFDDENSVEMQIPFVQAVFKDAKIVPIAFGNQSYGDAEILAKALVSVLKGRNDYIVIASTDMSHFHPYDEANSIDKHALKMLEAMKAKDLYEETGMKICELCGIMPVTTTLLAAESLGFDKIKTLKYANSGDTAGEKSSVVGYVSAVIYRNSYQLSAVSFQQEQKEGEAQMLSKVQKEKLLRIARESITSYVRNGKRRTFVESDAVLNEPRGAFVTLHERGELRGCIGNMTAQGPLYKTVADMAVEAATGDRRFSRVSTQELDKIDIEISVLSPLRKVASAEEITIPGDGVIVKNGFASGVYLPQVATETGWNKEEFLTSLCAHKAGLSSDAWKDPATEMYVFTAEIFGEKEK